MIIQIDVGYIFARIMRFYGLSYHDTLALPLRAFWFLNSQIDRMRAEEVLAVIPAHSISMGGSGDYVKNLLEGLRERVGTPVVTEKRSAEDGWRKIKDIFGGKRLRPYK